jgi:ABC-type nitrate/sulfonate/bicarbonate transport system substrate-binding protein
VEGTMNDFPARRDVLALAGGLAAGVLLQRSVFADDAKAHLNFGFQNSSWGAVGMIVKTNDLFKKAGADVTMRQFDGGKNIRDAMISSRIDVGVLGSTPFVVGAVKGNMVGLGIALYAGRTNSVVAAKGKGIKSIPDLKGKRVACQRGSFTAHVFTDKILPKYGLSTKDVTIVNMPHPNHIAALAAGAIDAFAGVEPYPSVAEIEGIGIELVDYSKFDSGPVMIAANRQVIEKDRAAVVALLRGWLEGVKEFKANPDASAKIVQGFFKAKGFELKLEVVKSMLSKLDVTLTYHPGIREYLQDLATNLMNHHAIPAMPDMNKVLNDDLMKAAKSG